MQTKNVIDQGLVTPSSRTNYILRFTLCAHLNTLKMLNGDCMQGRLIVLGKGDMIVGTIVSRGHRFR